jgi:hypothetical protein
MSSDDKSVSSTGGGQEIDKLIHEPARLMIMANLYVIESADFTYLMRQTGLTWGNLRPNTMLKLTKKGREAFKGYRNQILEILAGLPE